MAQGVMIVLIVVLAALTVLISVLLFKLRALRVMLLNAASKRDLENLYHQSEALDALYRDLEFTRALPRLRGNAPSPDYLREVTQHIWRRSPRFVVECGSGITTVMLAKALQRNGYGHVYSLDHDFENANSTYRLLCEHGLNDWATVIHANLVKYTLGGNDYAWYSLNDLPNVAIDMLVVDGPGLSTQKHSRYPALFLLRSRLSEQAVVMMNNAHRDDEVATLTRWSLDFPEFQFQRVKSERGCARGERIGAAPAEVEVLHTRIEVVANEAAEIPIAREHAG